MGAFQLAELLCAAPDWVEQRVVMQRLLDHGISTRRGITDALRRELYK
jgi:hypothetical protein